VDEVEDLAEITAEPVEGVHHDRVAAAGILEHLDQAGPGGGGAGLLVGVDPLGGDASGGQGVELPVEALLGGGHPRVPEI
jgi:hypothetical protein